MLTTSDFFSLFPEFTTTDPDNLAQISSALTMTFAANCGFLGMPENVQPVAMGLDAASYLMVSGYNCPNTPFASGNAQIKSVESYDDEIEFYQASNNAMEGQYNKYQILLNSMIAKYGAWAVSAQGSCGGCL